MIRLFRKIRHQLLSEDKYSIYILYASGEIILVVVGILFALQIDNWNEKRVEQNKVEVYLGSLVETLQEEIEKLNNVQIVNAFRFKSINYILEMAGHKPVFTDTSKAGIDSSFIWNGSCIPDTIDMNLIKLGFIWSPRYNDFSYNHGTIDELKSTGLFSYIDERLKKNINYYYERIEWLFGERKEAQQLNNSREFRESIRDVYGVLISDPSVTGKLFTHAQIDPQFVLRLNEQAASANYRAQNAAFIMAKALLLIENIDQEITD